MNKQGPIIIIEDDEDDRYIIEQAFAAIKCLNERKYFPDGISALDFLRTDESQPFFVLCDVNMPKMNGIQLREIISADVDLNYRCFPFIFFSTTSSQQTLIDAYKYSPGGFFIKPNTIPGYEKALETIIQYWSNSMIYSAD